MMWWFFDVVVDLSALIKRSKDVCGVCKCTRVEIFFENFPSFFLLKFYAKKIHIFFLSFFSSKRKKKKKKSDDDTMMMSRLAMKLAERRRALSPRCRRLIRPPRRWCERASNPRALFSRAATSSTTARASSRNENLQQKLDANRIKNRRECLPIPTAIIAVKSNGGDESTLYKKLEKDFETKIKRYVKFELISTPQNPKNEKDIDQQKESEGDRVMKKIDSRDFVVLLCERGKSFTSEKFASDVLAKSGDLGHGRLVFVIGGPFGHAKEVESRADIKLRLSEMVMNHRVARIMLLEQIYRAWTIVRGEPYHH